MYGSTLPGSPIHHLHISHNAPYLPPPPPSPTPQIWHNLSFLFLLGVASLPRSRFWDVTQRWGASRDIQKTAARETRVLQPSQEKLKTMLMQNFGGQIRCIMVDVQVAYS